MYDKSQDIPALLSSRICHDLASPLGAIANGLELLELTGLADTPEAALLSDSVKSASARIEFFRIAFGPAEPQALISAAVAQRTLSQNYDGRKVSVTWQPTADCPRLLVKLLFLLTQATESALPFGGEVTITEGETDWMIRATGREVRTPPEVWNHLTDTENTEPLQSAQVQFALARAQALELSKSISFAATKDTLLITVS